MAMEKGVLKNEGPYRELRCCDRPQPPLARPPPTAGQGHDEKALHSLSCITRFQHASNNVRQGLLFSSNSILPSPRAASAFYTL